MTTEPLPRIDHAFRIPVHPDAAYRVAALMAEPIANRRRITLDLTIKDDPAGDHATTETITAIPRRLTVEHLTTDADDLLVFTYLVDLEAATDLAELILEASLDAPPSARTDPFTGALRALELELIRRLNTGDVYVPGPFDEVDPVPSPDQG